MTPLDQLAPAIIAGAVLGGLMLVALALSGCAGSAPGRYSGPVADPYLHAEEPALAAFCRSHPGHGTCPR